LWRQGRSDDVLTITTPLLGSGPAENQSSFDIAKFHAYALARTGCIAEALATIAPEIPRLGDLPLWDQCELVHLLGEIMQRQGRIALTVHYLMHERALNSPALDRRLHNRRHLYNAIREAHPGDLELALQIAREGLGLAREADDEDMARFFADQLAWTACFTVDTSRLRATLDTIGGDPELTSSRPVALATAVSAFLDPASNPRSRSCARSPTVMTLWPRTPAPF
jgi:hypothetical protein